jgi:hypothetical protein
MTPPTPDTLTVLDFLSGHHPQVHPGTVAALIRLGAHDPLAAATGLDTVTAGQVRALAATWDGPWPGDLAHLLTIIGDVGARAAATAPDLLPEWAQVAERVRTLARGDLRQVWRPRLPDAVTAFCDAGRGPAYANDMLDAAVHARIAPDTFGYGPQVTGALLRELAAAGIRTAADLAGYTALGLDTADAMHLATEKVGPRAAAWATATGMPRAKWAGTLAGLPDHWFPSPGDDGAGDLISRGFTVAELRFLLEHGWASLRAHDLDHFLLRGKHTPHGKHTREQVLQAAAAASREDLSRWFEALTSGKPGSDWRSTVLLPLMARWAGVTAVAEQVARLSAAGVKPSHLGRYRAAGARSVDDILTAVAAGVTPARAKHLIEVAGQRADRYSPLRLASMADLLAAHARTPAG